MSKKLVVFVVLSIALLTFFLLTHLYIMPQLAKYMPTAVIVYGLICMIIVCGTNREWEKLAKALKENHRWIEANIIYLMLLGVMPNTRVFIGLMLCLINFMGYVAYRSRETSC